MRTNKTAITQAVLLFVTSFVASAQEAALPTPPPTEDTTVVITGSRLVNRGFLAPTPVTVVDAEELKVSGTQNLENLLNDTPQFTATS